jgi:uncharacterized integral membrane protein (TIGR00698 family)
MKFNQMILPLIGMLCLTLWVSSGIALALGVATVLLFGNPYMDRTRKLTHSFLGIAVMGLGAGMNLHVVGQVGMQGIGYTIIGISSALILGTILGRFLKVSRDTSLLVTVGTAICGGSAIAAIAPVIRAKSHEVSVALGTVFVLNAVGLFIFPTIGHHFSLSEAQFGLWSALAIHDTSSVVGATLQYGAHALEVGTTVKLARALWIIPLAFGIGYLRAKENLKSDTKEKPKRPWFILGFIIAAAMVTWIPELRPFGHQVEMVAKRLLVLTLFLIGTNLTKETIKSVGIRPFVQGVSLWIIVASCTLFAIHEKWIGL